MVPYFHSILGRDFDSEVRIEKFQRFRNFPIPDSRDSQKIPKLQNLWNFSILTSESHPGPKIEWKWCSIWPKWPDLRDSSRDSKDSKSVKFFKFQLFNIRIGSGALIWLGKVPHLGKTVKFGVFVERFYRFQKIPEFLEFFDSDSRIGFSDKNWVGKTPHTVILAKNGRIISQIGNRLIKISWNQLIFYSDQSWSKSHLYWIYSWFLKIPVATLLFGHFYGPIKWLDWPSFSEKAGLCWFFIRKSKKAIRGLFHVWQRPTHMQNGVSKFQGPGLGRGHFGL